MTFLKNGLTIQTVIHELIHAYTEELAFNELDLDSDQVEEFYAELFARHGQHILAQADIIFSAFLR